MTSKKEYWQINTERIADEIRAAAQDARTEEDLKMRVGPISRKWEITVCGDMEL